MTLDMLADRGKESEVGVARSITSCLCICSAGALFLLSGCGLTVDRAISRYHEEAGKIALGDSKDKVLSILQPIEESIPSAGRRLGEAFLVVDQEGKEHRVEIYFSRSAHYPDGVLTDDEFTPYLFRDGYLVAIGWAYLGGPKTVFQSEQHKKIQNTRCRADYMGGFNCTTTTD